MVSRKRLYVKFIRTLFVCLMYLNAYKGCLPSEPLFCPPGVALVDSRPLVLLWEVIPESNARASNFPLLRYLTMSGRQPSVRKKVSLPVEQSTLSHASLWWKKWRWCRFSFVFRGLVECVPPQTSYLLDKTGDQNSNICDDLSAFEKLSHSSTTALRDIEGGKDVLIMFEFKLKARGLLAKYIIKIHSHERCKKAQRTVFTET